MAWLVLRLTKGDGFEAERTLREEGAEAYNPVETFFRIHRRDPSKTPREQQRSLFHGYLFVAIPRSGACPIPDLRAVFGSHMTGHFMSFNNKYLTVTDKAMEGVRAVEGQIRADARTKRPNGKIWSSGDSVMILRGLLAGSMGTILDVRKRNLFVGLKGGGRIFVDVGMVKEPLAR